MNIIFFIFPLTAVIGFMIGKFWSKAAYKFQKKLIPKTPLRKYHIHHSVAGLIIFFTGILLPTASLKAVFVGLGMGLFIEHTLSEGFKFVTKE